MQRFSEISIETPGYNYGGISFWLRARQGQQSYLDVKTGYGSSAACTRLSAGSHATLITAIATGSCTQLTGKNAATRITKKPIKGSSQGTEAPPQGGGTRPLMGGSPPIAIFVEFVGLRRLATRELAAQG